MSNISNYDFNYNLHVDKSSLRDISSYKCTDHYSDLASSINTSLDELVSYNHWYLIDGVYYYFKNQFMFAELFMSELLKEFNIDGVEYTPVISNGSIGIMSKNFRKQGINYYRYYDYFNKYTSNTPSRLSFINDSLRKDIPESSKRKLLNTLSRILVVDFFSGQNDRLSCNLTIAENNNIPTVAPIVDNGGSLHNDTLNTLRSCVDNLVFPSERNVTPEEYYTLELIINNKEFRDYLIKCLGINIYEVLLRTLEKYKLKLSSLESEVITTFFSRKKDVINRTLSLIKKEN